MKQKILSCGAAILAATLFLTACVGKGGEGGLSSSAGLTSTSSREADGLHESSTASAGEESSALTSSQLTPSENTGVAASNAGSAASGSASSGKNSSKTSKPSSAVSSKPSGGGSSASTQEKLLNGAKLNPMRTGCKAVDQKVDEIFKKIHTPGMSTYAKVKACFDYLVKNGVYTRGNYMEPPSEGIMYASDYDAMLVRSAYEMLSTNEGVCDDYTAAFVVMTRAIGLESYYVGGWSVNTKGEKRGHAWANIKINGTYYIFDPQVQQKSKTPYYFFCKTDEALKKTYIYDDRDEYIKQFKSFQHYPEVSGQIIVSDGVQTRSVSYDDRESEYGAASIEDRFYPADGMITVTVKPSGGRGKYRCVIEETVDHHSTISVDEVITGEKTFTFRVRPDGEYYCNQLAVFFEDMETESNTACFEFECSYDPR